MYVCPQLGIQDDAREGGADAAEAYISLHPRAGLAKQLKFECCQCGPCQRGAARPSSQRGSRWVSLDFSWGCRNVSRYCQLVIYIYTHTHVCIFTHTIYIYIVCIVYIDTHNKYIQNIHTHTMNMCTIYIHTIYIHIYICIYIYCVCVLCIYSHNIYIYIHTRTYILTQTHM